LADWPVYVINMDANQTRLARVAEELGRAGVAWERLPAVNGRALSAEETARVYDAKANARRARHDLVAPEIGCYLSHVRAAEWLRDGGFEAAVILEDDMRVTGDLAGVIAGLQADLAALPGAWDLVKLFSFKPVALTGVRQVGPGVSVGRPDRVPSTTLGYVLTRAGAEKILARVPPIFRPVDEDHKHFWEFGLKVAMIDPQPIAIGEQETPEGTVGESRRRMGKRDGALRRVWRTIRYQANYRLRLALSRGR
jgi:glycosyl transferase family 25